MKWLVVLILCGPTWAADNSAKHVSGKPTVRSSKASAKKASAQKAPSRPAEKPVSDMAESVEANRSSPDAPVKSVRQKPEIRKPPEFGHPNWLVGGRGTFWQESLAAKRGTSQTHFPSQFTGMSINLTGRKRIGPSPRYFYTLGVEGAFGVVKSSGNTTGFPDKLLNQPWLSVGLSPGLMARGTDVTHIYFFVPVTYRKIFWQTRDSTLKMGDHPFSAGLGLLAANRITPTLAFVAGMVHQGHWRATQWQAGFDFDF